MDVPISTACYSNELVISMIGEIFKNQSSPILNGRIDSRLEPFLFSHSATSQGGGGFQGVLSSFLPHILALIVVIVAVSRILQFCLSYFKEPLIVCQLIAGILVFSFLPKPTNSLSIDTSTTLLDPTKRRLEHVIGSIGILFNLFIAALKFDSSTLFHTGHKNPLIIGLSSLFIPLIVGSTIYALNPNELPFAPVVLYPLSTTMPITLTDILTELGLLNSDLGRLALASSMMQVILGWVLLVTLTVVGHAKKNIVDGVWALLSFVAIFAFVMLIVRPYTRWIVRNTPAKVRVRDLHIFMMMLILYVLALACDIAGSTFSDAPVLMGLVMPHGPPLGPALIERVDLVASELLLPLVFMHEGFLIDWSGLKDRLSYVLLVEFLVGATFVAKLVANAVAASVCKMPLKDGILLGLMMNFRGLVDMLLFLSLATQKDVLDRATFTAFVLSTIAITAICVPLVARYYKPLAMRKKISLRSVNSANSHAELRVMTCFYDDKIVPALLEFLECSSSTEVDNPLCVYTLHLVELQGSVASNLIDHRDENGSISTSHMDRVHNHFLMFEKSKKEGVTVLPFTSITPLKTMHQDVCSLVLERSISLVIVPFPKKNSLADFEANTSMRDLVPSVLEQAPCSVGIMVYHSRTEIMDITYWEYRVGVLFWGGPDDREAIAIASRLSRHPNVYLNIIRFLPFTKTESREENNKDGAKTDYEDKLLDGEVIAGMKAAYAENNRVGFTEIIVGNMEQAFYVIQSLGDKNDLLIVGRRQEYLLMLDGNFDEWTESPELGVVGDMLATEESCVANVLVVQQHSL